MSPAVQVHPDWVRITIPDSTPPVALLRLHHDPATHATVSLVRFPPAWHRPTPGHYTSGEEFTLLAGHLTINNTPFTPGDWAWLPPRTHRLTSASPHGAVALAWFSGPPTWLPTTPAPAPSWRRHPLPAPTPGSPSLLRPPHPHIPGFTATGTPTPRTDPHHHRELLHLPTRRWLWLPANTPAPPHFTPTLTRHWPAP